MKKPLSPQPGTFNYILDLSGRVIGHAYTPFIYKPNWIAGTVIKTPVSYFGPVPWKHGPDSYDPYAISYHNPKKTGTK